MKYPSEFYKELYTHLISRLGEYAEYIQIKLGDKFDINDLVTVTYDKVNGMAQAVVYPKASVVDGEGVVNPMFFCGYYVYQIEDYKLEIKFSTNPQEYQEMLKKGSERKNDYLPKRK